LIEKRSKSPLNNDPVALLELPLNFIMTFSDEDKNFIKNFVLDI
jgi:hypothetical protein